MATLFVSNSTANSMQVGIDTHTYTQAQTNTTGWLTLAHALANALSGDTITVNDGTYVEAGPLVVPVSVTVAAQTAHLAIIQVTGAKQAAFLIDPPVITVALTNLIIDGESTPSNYGIAVDANRNFTTLTTSGTVISNTVVGKILNGATATSQAAPTATHITDPTYNNTKSGVLGTFMTANKNTSFIRNYHLKNNYRAVKATFTLRSSANVFIWSREVTILGGAYGQILEDGNQLGKVVVRFAFTSATETNALTAGTTYNYDIRLFTDSNTNVVDVVEIGSFVSL